MIFIRRVGRRVYVCWTYSVVVCTCYTVMYIRHMIIIIIIVVILIYDDNHHEPRRYKIFTTPDMYIEPMWLRAPCWPDTPRPNTLQVYVSGIKLSYICTTNLCYKHLLPPSLAVVFFCINVFYCPYDDFHVLDLSS